MPNAYSECSKYPMEAICGSCGQHYGNHWGMTCPTGSGGTGFVLKTTKKGKSANNSLYYKVVDYNPIIKSGETGYIPLYSKAEKVCKDVGPQGLFCTRGAFHRGKHVAHGASAAMIASWLMEEQLCLPLL